MGANAKNMPSDLDGASREAQISAKRREEFRSLFDGRQDELEAQVRETLANRKTVPGDAGRTQREDSGHSQQLESGIARGWVENSSRTGHQGAGNAQDRDRGDNQLAARNGRQEAHKPVVQGGPVIQQKPVLQQKQRPIQRLRPTLHPDSFHALFEGSGAATPRHILQPKALYAMYKRARGASNQFFYNEARHTLQHGNVQNRYDRCRLFAALATATCCFSNDREALLEARRYYQLARYHIHRVFKLREGRDWDDEMLRDIELDLTTAGNILKGLVEARGEEVEVPRGMMRTGHGDELVRAEIERFWAELYRTRMRQADGWLVDVRGLTIEDWGKEEQTEGQTEGASGD